MGNSFQCDTYSMLDISPNIYKLTFNNYHMDEIWISPQFEFSKDYYKYRRRVDDVKIVPFFWNPSYLTITSEKAIASAAIIGLSNPKAAIGMAITL